MEDKLYALLGNYDRQTDWPTERGKDVLIGKFLTSKRYKKNLQTLVGDWQVRAEAGWFIRITAQNL